jgi:hypothetical protein
MHDTWYYMTGGQQTGPVSFDELEQLIRSGQLRGTDEVWRMGTPDWVPYNRVAPHRPAHSHGSDEARRERNHRPSAATTVALADFQLPRIDFGKLRSAPGADVVLRNNALSAGCSLVFCAMVIVGGGWILSWAGPKYLPPFILGLILVGGGLVGVILNLVLMLDSSPKLVLGSTKIINHRGRRDCIGWNRITAARLSNWTRNGSVASAFVTLTVLDEILGKKVEVPVNVFGLDWSPERIFQEIGRRAGLR